MLFGRLVSRCCNKAVGALVVLLYSALIIYSVMVTDYFGIIVAGIFGILSIYIAVRMESLIHEMRRGQIDEKIAVTYRTASEVNGWKRDHIDRKFIVRKVIADLKAAWRNQKSMTTEQRKELPEARSALTKEMRKHGFHERAKEIEDETTFLN